MRRPSEARQSCQTLSSPCSFGRSSGRPTMPAPPWQLWRVWRSWVWLSLDGGDLPEVFD